MKTSLFVIGAVVVALGAGAAWHFHVGANAAQPAAEKADEASVLVRVQPVSRQALTQTLDTFGEIATGKPESLSFPQPGQLLQLPVVLGQHLRRGDPVAVIGTDPTTVAAYAQASNAVGFARRELQRQQELAQLQLATQSQVDGARKQLEDSQAALAAQAKLGGAHASVTLTAPFDAVVTALPVAQGERVAAGAPVAQLGPTGNPRALLAIEPARSAVLKPGMAVTIKPLLDGAAPITARIGEVGGVVDPKTQMVTAIAELDRRFHACAAGETAGLCARQFDDRRHHLCFWINHALDRIDAARDRRGAVLQRLDRDRHAGADCRAAPRLDRQQRARAVDAAQLSDRCAGGNAFALGHRQGGDDRVERRP